MIDIEGMRKAVSKAFLNAYGDSRQIQAALKKVENGLANYAGITDYSVQTGQLLSKVLLDAINEECLENGYLLKDVADGVVDPSIMKAYDEVAGTASQVQANINQEAGLSFNALEGQIDRSRVTNLTKKLTGDEFEKVKWLLNPDVLENITRSAVTDTLRENAKFHKEAGIHPYLRRYSRGKCCDWCDSMQGTYEFGEQPDDFWRIHKHCTCIIEYKPSKYKRADIISYVTGEDGKMSKMIDSGEDDDIIISGGRITNPDSSEGIAFAESFYPEIRKRTTDSAKIAKNINKSEKEIQKIKNYLFMDKSLFDEDLQTWRQFDPDCTIAQSWQRLTDGKSIKPHDRTLIEHELYEIELKQNNPKLTHYEAHILASRKFNYDKEAAEYYANLEKNKKGQ